MTSKKHQDWLFVENRCSKNSESSPQKESTYLFRFEYPPKKEDTLLKNTNIQFFSEAIYLQKMNVRSRKAPEMIFEHPFDFVLVVHLTPAMLWCGLGPIFDLETSDVSRGGGDAFFFRVGSRAGIVEMRGRESFLGEGDLGRGDCCLVSCGWCSFFSVFAVILFSDTVSPQKFERGACWMEVSACMWGFGLRQRHFFAPQGGSGIVRSLGYPWS